VTGFVVIGIRKAAVALVAAGVATAVLLAGAGSPATARLARSPVGSSPIEHVVVIYQENHSFDNVLGPFCVTTGRCDGASSGQTSDGRTIPLTPALDVVARVEHDVYSQQLAINGGLMNGFDLVGGCEEFLGFVCYSAYKHAMIPNLWTLASTYAVSDRTFQTETISSWAAHLELVAATADGFTGDNPVKAKGVTLGKGWGCDSNRVTYWKDPLTGQVSKQPSCVPDQLGNGPFRPSPVAYVPTILGELDAAALSWKLYASKNPPGQPRKKANPYGWAICPTFAECIYGPQAANMVETDQILTDAAAGQLPNFSIVLPDQRRSQHNSDSMIKGDNWIGKVVSAIQADAADWPSTAIFITYDDCGCFYDHVPPPPGLGLRVPMVVVSPYAIQGTDSTNASLASLLAFTEHAFGLAPLTEVDGNAYDYAGSFDYGAPPRLNPVRMLSTAVPAASLRYMRTHPPDPDDPT
jgi:phospholipase C